MGFNHVAVASSDIEATHRFYTEAMGFRLAKAVNAPTPEGGWARHLFYDTGEGGYIAFWDLHMPNVTQGAADLNTPAGLPRWVNHIAFNSPDPDDFAARTRRWQEHGITVVELDHGFCRSIYTNDPNGIMVEFCLMTRALGADDEAEAVASLAQAEPELEVEPPKMTVHRPLEPAEA